MFHSNYKEENIFQKFFGPEGSDDKGAEKKKEGEKKVEKTEEQKQIEACDAGKKVEGGCAKVYEKGINSMLGKNAGDVLSGKKKLSEVDGLDEEDQKELQKMLDRRKLAQEREKKLEGDKQSILTGEKPKEASQSAESKSPEQQKQEFLTQNKTPAERLKALGVESSSITQGSSLDIPSEKLPAGITPAQIIPENVASLKVGDATYTRINGSRGGEFKDEKGNILTGENMKNAKVEQVRSSDDIKKLSDAEGKGLEKYKDLEKYIAQKAKEKGINPDVFITAMKSKLDTNYLGDNSDEQKKLKEDTWKKENIDKEVDALATVLSSNAEALKGGDVSAVAEALQKTNPDDWVDTSKQALIKAGKTPAEADTTLKDYIQGMLNTGGPHQRKFGNYTQARDWANSMIGGAKSGELGSLSEEFESGGKGPLAKNGNDNGKPSFGTYQLRDGALKQFADEMGIQGNHTETFTEGSESEFAKNWDKKVKEVGAEAFKKKEHEFIKKTHFDVLAKSLPFDVSKSSMTLQNVIWSIAVQHGPGRKEVITNALSQMGGEFTPGDQAQEKQLIQKIYAERTKQFGNQSARYQKEQGIALAQMNMMPSGTANVPEGGVQSVPASKNPETGVTQCSNTAYLNASRFGIQAPRGDAKQVERSYGSRLSGTPPGDAKVVDVFSNSVRYPQYGHRSIAYQQNGQWFVLDPYLPATGTWSQKPIPLQTYTSYLNSRGRGPAKFAKLG